VFAGQPFWGSRVEKLGVGVTIPFQTLAQARLLAGLRRLLDDGVQTRARELGAALREERGLHEVADALLA
jgi:UDP:flavonoid glycosyltransferase YjiC (YdhE family)